MNEKLLIFNYKALTAIIYSIQESQIEQPSIWGPRYQSQIKFDPNADSGNNQIESFKSANDFINFFKRFYNQVKYSIIIGSKAETTYLYEAIINKIGKRSIIFFYDPSSHQQQVSENTFREIKPQSVEIDLRQLLTDVAESVNVSQKTYFQAIEKSINDLKVVVNGLQQSRTTPTVSGRSGNDVAGLKDTIGNMAETLRQTRYFAEELYNNMSTRANTSGSEARIEELQNELGKYKNDFFLKVSLQYVNSAIEMLCIMYEDLYNLKSIEGPESPSVERMQRVIAACEAYVKRWKIVRIRKSNSGDPWDPNSMRAYDDRILTEREELKGHVACSISPAFFWTLPRVNAPDTEHLLLKEETIALFE